MRDESMKLRIDDCCVNQAIFTSPPAGFTPSSRQRSALAIRVVEARMRMAGNPFDPAALDTQ